MTKVKVRLKKPLDGMEEGTETEFDKADIAGLEAMHAIEVITDDVAPPAEKASPAPANKAAPAPKNKAE